MKSKIKLFKWNKFSLPKVVRKKLGRNSAYGLYGNNLIEVDARLKGVEEMEILIHELAHWQYPEWSEDDIRKHSRILADFLWRENYRKIDSL